MCLWTFSTRIPSFHFSFFVSPVGSFRHDFGSLEALRRNSGPSRACLKLSWSLFWVPRDPKGVSKVSIVGLCEPLRKHAPACTEPTLRPLPWRTETGPKARYVKNTPKLHLARSRRALLVPRGASGVLQRAHQEAEWAPETPPEEYSGTLAVPKCVRNHTLDGILAQSEVRSGAP